MPPIRGVYEICSCTSFKFPRTAAGVTIICKSILCAPSRLLWDKLFLIAPNPHHPPDTTPVTMVCVFSFFRTIFSARKKTNSGSTPLFPPPPEYVQVCASELPPEKSPLSEEPLLLNPNLHFTANDIESQLAVKDARFAAAVVELMLPRLKLGVWHEPVGWGHYSFTMDKVRSPCLRMLF